jgi:Na+/H+ antiporter NhaD/arsenite permease-like protein
MKHAFLVAIFLAGLVILGSIQVWWLRSLLENVPERFLFFGATALTSIMDNAALTYLGSLVNLSSVARYALVAGAVAGGGLTVIANAPNPAGFKILQNKFRNSKNEVGIEHLKLFIWALFPTVIAMICFLFLP